MLEEAEAGPVTMASIGHFPVPECPTAAKEDDDTHLGLLGAGDLAAAAPQSSRSRRANRSLPDHPGGETIRQLKKADNETARPTPKKVSGGQSTMVSSRDTEGLMGKVPWMPCCLPT